MKTTMTTEQPVQVIHGYVPLIAVDQCPDWAMNQAMNQHGGHRTLPDGRCMVLVESRSMGVPPGAWIVVYWYDDENGCNGFDLFVAAKVRDGGAR